MAMEATLSRMRRVCRHYDRDGWMDGLIAGLVAFCYCDPLYFPRCKLAQYVFLESKNKFRPLPELFANTRFTWS